MKAPASAPAPRRATTSHLLYLHGFRSSPQSTKARMLAAWVGHHRPDLVWWCPQLPASPAKAIDILLDHLAGWPAEGRAVIGSSLGGFYATVLAERLDCPVVLLNPAIDPARDLAAYAGSVKAWHSDDSFEFEPTFVDELRDLTPARIEHLDNYLVVIAKGDEVLDWREMSARYAGCSQLMLEGSDHALSDFDRQLPVVLDALGLR